MKVNTDGKIITVCSQLTFSTSTFTGKIHRYGDDYAVVPTITETKTSATKKIWAANVKTDDKLKVANVVEVGWGGGGRNRRRPSVSNFTVATAGVIVKAGPKNNDYDGKVLFVKNVR